MSTKKKNFMSQTSMEKKELQDSLAVAAAVTQNQGSIHLRRKNHSAEMTQIETEKQQPLSVIAGETMMKSAELQLMTPLLHFLQLLCENHNIKLQVGAVLFVCVYVCLL